MAPGLERSRSSIPSLPYRCMHTRGGECLHGGAVALRYAKALIDLAARDDRVAEIGEQLRQHRQLLDANADLQKVLYNPSVSAEVKANVLTRILERTQPTPLLRSFILLLVHRDR